MFDATQSVRAHARRLAPTIARRTRPTTSPWLLALLTGACGAALAQTPPDAGSLLKQIEKDAAPRAPTPDQRPKTTPAPQELQGGAGITTVKVRAFAFTGNRLLDEAALAAVVAPWVGRTVDLNELRRATTAVAEAYRARGWVVRAYLPRQDVTEGRIVIHVVEAVFGGARLNGAPSTRVAPARVQAMIERQQASGVTLDTTALDRGLLLADDLPGITVSGALAPGAREGETALALALADEPLLGGEINLDNGGARSTGSARAVALLGLNSPFGRGEQFTGQFMLTRGSQYARLAAGLPLGLDGLRAGLSVSRFEYRLVSSDYEALKARGSADTVSADLSYPVLRSRLANIALQGNLDHRRFDNRANGATSSRYTVDALSVGLVANRFGDFGGGFASTASLTYTGGRVDLASNPGPRADGSGGRFGKLRYAVAHQQAVTTAFTLHGAFSGQWADKNLDSSEKFSLGGMNGVRAYAGNEGMGASGQLLTLEARLRVLPSLGLIAFHDRGRVTQYRDDTGAAGGSLSGAAPNRYTLAGSGLGLVWSGPRGSTVRAQWARRHGDNPNPTANGNDQDGSLKDQRFWLSVAMPF